MGRTIVQSVKNQFAVAQSIVVATKIVLDYATGVNVGEATKVLGNEVPTGAKIFNIALSVNFVTLTGTETATFQWYIAKIRAGQSNAELPSPQWSDIGLSELRNQIFHSEMAQVGTEDAGPYKFNRIIKIPRIYQRMRTGDRLAVIVQADGVGGSIDIGARYKYYQ